MFVVGARLVLVATAGAAAAATGWAEVGAAPAEVCPAGLVKKMSARMRPMSARRQRSSQIHQGQGSFWALTAAGGGAYLPLDILELTSQLGPLTVWARGSSL